MAINKIVKSAYINEARSNVGTSLIQLIYQCWRHYSNPKVTLFQYTKGVINCISDANVCVYVVK